MDEKIIIVNENDEIIGSKERGTLNQEDIYRVSALMITNSRGQILLARRAWTKKQHPGVWDPAVAGTVAEGESYFSNILREAKEELGLEDIQPIEGPKTRTSGDYNYFGQWYFLQLDKPIGEFKIDPIEVAEVKWIDKDDLFGEIEKNPQNFTTSSKKWRSLLTESF